MDDGEKRDGRGRRLTAAARRAELVRAYRGSGLTMAAFARQERIKYATFAGWMWKAAKEPARRRALDFAEVRLPLLGSSRDLVDERLEVRLPDGTVVRGARVEELATLVRALQG
ncbi:MAG: hypothetical protein ABIY47_03075 [Opitutaceae bacterium]